MSLTVKNFFGDIFINSYVFAMKEGAGQIAGSIPTNYCNSDQEANEFFEKNYFDLNTSGYGIHFTPNGVKTLEEKNRKENFSHINAWYLDVDIEETKVIKDHDGTLTRERIKSEILGAVFSLPIMPSLTVETRNGYHLYWFALPDATIEEFNFIQRKLVHQFHKFGGDGAASGIMHTLRVPYFKFYKNGEEGQILPFMQFSTLKLYSQVEMLDWVRTIPAPVIDGTLSDEPVEIFNKYGKKLTINLFRSNDKNIFEQINQKPIKTWLEILSGSSIVEFEVFSLVKTANNKFNVISNGKATPNWIDLNTNQIYSNNQAGFCNIVHFLAWYGYSVGEIVTLLKKYL
jgi:hypothetical protein